MWAAAAAAAEGTRLAASVPARATPDRLLGRAAAADALEMSLTLQLQHGDELQALLSALQQPGSPTYHRWLSSAEFTARFAPSAIEYESVATWLEQQGFGVRRRENRLRIDFGGNVASVERTFDVRMNYYRHRGRSHLANENAPLIPAEFAARVAFIRLNTFPLARPHVHLVQDPITTNTMGPLDLQTAYDATPLLDRGIDGSGQTIAVVARSDFLTSDVTLFQQRFGTVVRAPTKVFPGTNPGIGSPGFACGGIRNRQERLQCIQSEETEAVLDAEWANAMAPGASVLVDISDADIDQSLFDIVNNHPEATIIGMSFGDCERLAADGRRVFAPIYVQAAAQGQTILVATGDGGADDCEDGKGASVDVLASDPNVTAVGGTSLDPGFNAVGNATGYFSEEAWNDGQGASGGGPSELVSKPTYQQAPGVPADGARDVPDVALIASVVTPGYVTIVEGTTAIIGGTSAGAQAWAGIVALLNQARQSTAAGAINTWLYAVGRKQYTDGSISAFHDVTIGNNSVARVPGYNAGPGYDLVTGLGTPDVDTLSRAPNAEACAGDCNGDGMVTIDEVLTAVNMALGVLPPSACDLADAAHDGAVTIDDVVRVVTHALKGC